MISWDPGVGRTTPDRENETSIVGGLARLAEGLTELDATDPDTDSISFDRAADRLIALVRHLVTAARPVLDHPGALHAAVREAIDDRRDLPEWCHGCQQTAPDLCDDHAADLAQADVYEGLLPAVVYGGLSGPVTG